MDEKNMSRDDHARALREQAATLADDARELAHRARAAATDTIDEVRRRSTARISDSIGDAEGTARKTYDDARERARSTIESGRESVDQMGERFSRQMHEHPLRTVLIAAGVGALFGLCMRMRGSDDESED